MAEIGLAEFINQFMYNYNCEHVGKDLFRAKTHEEDILVKDELTQATIPISLKAYGDGPLQLSTDKDASMYPSLESIGIEDITDREIITDVFASDAFSALQNVNVMPLIYKEKTMKCNIMVFDFDKMLSETKRILKVPANKKYDEKLKQIIVAKGRKHPIYMFLNAEGKYICEVRYGGAAANALQRGFWTHTINACSYFNSLTNGWISYEHNQILVELFRLALNASKQGHEAANKALQEDINNMFNQGNKNAI